MVDIYRLCVTFEFIRIEIHWNNYNNIREFKVWIIKVSDHTGFEVIAESLEVEFTLLVPTHGWIGFGISEVGSMKGADIAVIEPKEDGTFKLTDRYSKDFVKPTIDKIQSWELLEATQQENFYLDQCDQYISLSTIKIRRMLDTCDAEDETLTPDFLQNYFISTF